MSTTLSLCLKPFKIQSSVLTDFQSLNIEWWQGQCIHISRWCGWWFLGSEPRFNLRILLSARWQAVTACDCWHKWLIWGLDCKQPWEPGSILCLPSMAHLCAQVETQDRNSIFLVGSAECSNFLLGEEIKGSLSSPMSSWAEALLHNQLLKSLTEGPVKPNWDWHDLLVVYVSPMEIWIPGLQCCWSVMSYL